MPNFHLTEIVLEFLCFHSFDILHTCLVIIIANFVIQFVIQYFISLGLCRSFYSYWVVSWYSQPDSNRTIQESATRFREILSVKCRPVLAEDDLWTQAVSQTFLATPIGRGLLSTICEKCCRSMFIFQMDGQRFVRMAFMGRRLPHYGTKGGDFECSRRNSILV
jgi:hypothetical protein